MGKRSIILLVIITLAFKSSGNTGIFPGYGSKTDLIIHNSSSFSPAPTTLYSYQSGAWDNPDVWTTDPGGTTLVNSKVPSDGDIVVILPSRTVTLVNGNVTNINLDITIMSGGILDQTDKYFTQTLSRLSGQGILRLKTNNYPSASTNIFNGSNGGTAEFYTAANIALPAGQASYYNLTINSSGFTVTQLSNITIYGNFIVQTGTFRINDSTATRRTLVVNGDITVNSGASLTVGAGNTTTTTDPTAIGTAGTAPFLDYYVAQAHRVEVYGNFTNNGTVKFTNQPYPVFKAFPVNGFASVFFRGAADNTLTCNGVTDFYNLIVDKGTDQTYILTINSAGYDKFRLFGANNAARFNGADASNPNIRKALWIRSGTLKLNGYVFIPSLVEASASIGSQYYIPANGALIIDGPDVVLMGTIDDVQVVNLAYGVPAPDNTTIGITTADSSNFAFYGKLQINNGYFYIGENAHIVYYGTSTAEFVINGGTIDTKQFQATSGGGKTAFWQTGGNMVLRGRFKRNLDYSSLANLISSIGNASKLNTARAAGTDASFGTLNIDQDANIFHMEGGNINIYDVTGTTGTPRALEINSDPSNVSVTGGSISIYMTTGTNLADTSYGIASKAPLYNLTVTRSSGTKRATLVTIPAKGGVTAVTSPPLMVLNNLTLTNASSPSANPVLSSGGFDVFVGGNFDIQANAVYTPGTNHTILNGTGAQRFTNSGTITSGLYKFFVDKNSGIGTLGSNITVRDSLAIFGGTLNDGGFTLSVGGNIYNAGTHTGSGKIMLNGNAKQFISSTLSALFDNLELNSTYNTVPYDALTLSSDISVLSAKLSGTRGVIYLADKKLTIRSTGIYLGNNATGYSATKMFMTDGSHTAKGINLSLSLTGNLNVNIDTIPLGVFHSATSTAWYTPLIINVNGNLGATTYSGTINCTPIDYPHPSTDPTKLGDVIPFYWKLATTGTLSSITSSFITYKLYNSYVTHPGGSKLAYLQDGATNWVWGANSSDPLNFNVGFISAAFSAGKNPSFNAPVTCKAIATGFWDQASTWTPRVPLSYDYVTIGGNGATNYTVTIRNSNATGYPNSAGVSIWANGIAGDAAKPTLIVNAGLTGISFTTVSGGGKFILKGSSTVNMPAGDFNFFCLNDTAIFEYNDDGAAGSNFTIPSSLTIYPNLHITNSRNGLIKTLPDVSLTILKNLRLYSSFTGNTLNFNGSINSRSISINGDIEFRDASQINIPATTGIKTINLYGSLNFRYRNTDHLNSIVVVSGTGTTHKFNFYGSTLISGNSLLTFYNNSGSNQMDLYFLNPGNTLVTNTTGATTNFNFNNLIINKDVLSDIVTFQNNFTLGAATSGSSKALRLLVGTLVIENGLNDINLSSGGTTCFSIPSTSALILRNGAKVNISGSDPGSGIRLDGLLQAEGSSEIFLADGTAGRTGYIEYSGSGNAAINLSGSSVLKAAQIRRSLSLTTGLLNYIQSGTSATTVYGLGTASIIDPSRAKFEVTGTGSSFNMSGTASLSIINGGGTTFGDLYLRPGNSTVNGGEIIFGTGVSGQVLKMDANVPLNNLTVLTTGVANTLQLMVNPLVLNGNLLLNNTNSTLTTNSIDLTLKGNFVNNGVYNAGTNTTTFNGSTQSISGSNLTTFWNLIVSPTVKVSLSHDINVNNTLNITGGILETTTYTVTVAGNVTNNGVYTNSPSPATSLLYLNGTSLQHIAGTGSFGRIELDNGAGARLDNNITLSENLKLTNGILDINQFLLTLMENSMISGTGFGVSKMIKSDGVFSNFGIQKYFTSGFSGTFVFPAGVTGKYTPAKLSVTSTGAGYLRINAINEKHPATVSPYNVLNYYWEAESNITLFEGNLKLKYSSGDVNGKDSLYVAARLIIPPGTGWSKAATGPSTDNVDELNDTISFDFPTGTINLGGQYTAGYGSDLPTNIPVYTSNVVSGNWDTPASWSPVAPVGGPNGFVVVINPGDTIYTNGNKRFAYKTTINGTLKVGTTYGHNLGTVDGTGKLALKQANLPAGDFASFLSCSGGTLEYGGTTNYTIVADRIDTVRNLLFTGSGTRTLANKDLVICNQIQINGPILENYYNRKLTVGGSFDLTSGAFLCGTGPGATVTFKGSSLQTITGFNGGSPLNNLEINNSAGLTLNSNIEINGNLLLTNGVINTTSSNKLKMINQSSATTVIPEGGSASSFVSGPMSKYEFGGNDFTFPLGKGSRYGKLTLLQVQTGTWEAEYFTSGYNPQNVSGLNSVSSKEYWKVISPSNGKTAEVQLRWDSQSDINPLTTSGGINDIRVAEYNGSNWIEVTSSTPVGGDTYGTVKTSTTIPINNTGDPQYFTLGSISIVKPTISLGSNPSVCSGSISAPLSYTGTTGGPDLYSITFDAYAISKGFANVGWTTLPASPIPITVPATAPVAVYNGQITVRKSSPLNTSLPYSFTITILFGQYWTGSLSSNWHAPGNWCSGTVPNGTGYIIIPSPVPNYPVISTSNVTISSGATLEIQNGASLTLNSGPVLTFQSGSTITTSTTGFIILQSDACYLNLSTSTPKIKPRRQIPATAKGWRMVASPVNTTFSDMFASPIVTQGFAGCGYPTLQPNLLWWNETDGGTPLQSWRTPASLASNISGGLGYFLYIFNGALRPSPLPGNYSDALPVTISPTGTENYNGSGNFSFSITKTPRSSGSPTKYIDVAGEGWNLVGNPTASTIDWDAATGWTKTNMDNSIYIWDPTANSNNGDYKFWNKDSLSSTLSSGRIAPFQAFWVHANAASPVLNMTNNAKTSVAGSFLKKGTIGTKNNEYKKTSPVVVPITLEGLQMKTTSFIVLEEGNKIGPDPDDVYRLEPMSNTWLAMYMNSSLSQKDPLVVNSLPLDTSATLTIPLYTAACKSGSSAGGDMILSWKIPENWPSDMIIELMDHENQKAISMVETDKYEYKLYASKLKGESLEAINPLNIPAEIVISGTENQGTKGVSSASTPFSIVIRKGDPATKPKYERVEATLLPLSPNPFSGSARLSFRLPEEAKVKIEVFDMYGRLIETPVNEVYPAGLSEIAWFPVTHFNGMFIIRLSSGSYISIQRAIRIEK